MLSNGEANNYFIQHKISYIILLVIDRYHTYCENEFEEFFSSFFYYYIVNCSIVSPSPLPTSPSFLRTTKNASGFHSPDNLLGFRPPMMLS